MHPKLFTGSDKCSLYILADLDLYALSQNLHHLFGTLADDEGELFLVAPRLQRGEGEPCLCRAAGEQRVRLEIQLQVGGVGELALDTGATFAEGNKLCEQVIC